MKTATLTQAIKADVVGSDENIRWFSADGCVVQEGELLRVFAGGTLIGLFHRKNEVGVRNLLLFGLNRNNQIRKNKLAQAFGLGPERLRVICRKVEEQRIEAIPRRPQGGRKPLATPLMRRRMESLCSSHRLERSGIESDPHRGKAGQLWGGCYYAPTRCAVRRTTRTAVPRVSDRSTPRSALWTHLVGGLAAALVLLGNFPAAAAQDLQGSRAVGMGGALRASPSADAAVYLNPAGMSLTRSYSLNAVYQFRASDTASLAGVSVVDSLTAKLAAGLFYSLIHATPDRTFALPGGAHSLEETLEGHEVGLAMSYPIANLVLIGLTGRYVNHKLEQPEDVPEGLPAGEDLQGMTLDAGAILRLGSFNLAATGHNLVPLDSDYFPRLLGLGASYTLGVQAVVAFDTVLDFTSADSVKASYHGGAEYFFANSVAVRAGVMHDTLREATYVTGGAGLVTKKLALELGLRQMVDGGAETMVATSLRVFVN